MANRRITSPEGNSRVGDGTMPRLDTSTLQSEQQRQSNSPCPYFCSFCLVFSSAFSAAMAWTFAP